MLVLVLVMVMMVLVFKIENNWSSSRDQSGRERERRVIVELRRAAEKRSRIEDMRRGEDGVSDCDDGEENRE